MQAMTTLAWETLVVEARARRSRAGRGRQDRLTTFWGACAEAVREGEPPVFFGRARRAAQAAFARRCMPRWYRQESCRFGYGRRVQPPLKHQSWWGEE